MTGPAQLARCVYVPGPPHEPLPASLGDLAALFLLLIALLVTINVMLRYFFSIEIPDWFDFSRQLQAIALFWGIAVTTYRARHISVDIVWEHLGPAGRQTARPRRHRSSPCCSWCPWPG